MGKEEKADGDVVTKTLTFTGSAMAIFFSLKFLLTKIVTIFTGDSHDPWQSLWDQILEITGDDFFTHHVYGTNLFMNLMFFGLGGIYIFFDLTNQPAFLRKYKIQPGTNEPLPFKRFLELMALIIFNQAVVGMLFSVFTYHCYMWKFDYNETILKEQTTHKLPDFTRVFLELLFFVLVEELGFFYSHYALHSSRFLYKNIHKRHHEWQATVAYAAIYAHPVEHVMSNLLPAALGPWLCGSHVATTWLWYTLVITNTLNSHCGYHFPFFPSPEAHDFHHLRFTQCFGTLGILDYLHGTDVLFRSNKAYKRHITLTGTKSARELFPDDKD